MRSTWENFYKKYGRYYLTPHPYLTTLINFLNKKRVKKVLDLGCGSGRHLIELARNGFSTYGVDFSEEALVLAKSWLDKFNLKATIALGDISLKLNFPDKFFDCVIAINTLEYVKKDNLESITSEIGRLLVDFGTLFITIKQRNNVKNIEYSTLSSKEIDNLIN